MENLERLIQQAKQKEREIIIKRPHEYLSDLEEYYRYEENPMSLIFPSFDENFRNKYRGKVIGISGKGGSKKSLLALQSMIKNTRYDFNCLYSTMEMPASMLISRMLDMTLELNQEETYDKQPSVWIEKQYSNKSKKMTEILEDLLKKLFKENVYITQQNRMVANDYRRAIKKQKELTGRKVDLLVVDGLSMMGGLGSETEVYTTNSAELKEIANEENMLILLILHVSRSCESTERNNHKFIRGSEKIMDNLDAVIQMSFIEKESEQGEYEKNIGYAKLWDKRGTGEHISRIFSFDSNTLKMTEELWEPKGYEVKKKKNPFN